MAIPAILQQLNSLRSPMMNDVLSMWKQVRNSRNPAGIMQQLAANNPQIRQIMNEAGNNPKQMFYTKCAEMGVNPDEILKMFK